MVALKNFIKNLLPLFLYRVLKKNFEKNKFTFVEKFSSYDAARSSTRTTDYINEDLKLSKSPKFHKLEDLEFDHKHNLLPIIFSILEKINSILEIGGGDNPALLYIEKANINKNIFPYKIICLKNLTKFLNLNSYSLIYEVELPTLHKHQYLGNILYRDLIFKKR
jgi:hypothetical protein